MANWRVHSKALTAFRRRWRLNVDPTEMLTGILPVAQVDKHWTDDTLNLYGCFTQHILRNVAPAYACCLLQAGRQEVLVHEVTMWLGNHAQSRQGWSYHLMTCHQNYNPVAQDLYSIWYPWLMSSTRSDRDLVLSYALGGSGDVANLQTIGTPTGPVTCYGKTLMVQQIIVPIGGGIDQGGGLTFWKFSDPPLRLKPYVTLIVQSAVDQFGIQPLTVNLPMNVNFIFSEREEQGDVG